MNKPVNALLLVSSVLFAPQVLATTASLTEWGTQANVVSGACLGNNCTPLEVLTNPEGITPEVTSDGFNQLSATTGSVSIPQGTAQSSAEITGGLATPVLKAKASSTTNSWIGAGAFAIQGYEYTGSVSDTISFNINFDGSITNPDGDTATGFGVGMYLFSSSELDSLADLSFDPYLVLENLSFNSFFNLVETQVYELDVTQAGAVSETGQVSIDLSNGDLFYLAGGVLASAGGEGAIADAFSTLTVEVDPEFEGVLVAASSSVVPLPAAFWLFISAFFGLFATQKRR